MPNHAWTEPAGGAAQPTAGEQVAKKANAPINRLPVVFNPILLNREASFPHCEPESQ
jgi:hypothetical protein